MKYFLAFETNVEGVLECSKLKGNEDGTISFKTIREVIGNIVQYVYHVNLGKSDLVIAIDEEGLLTGLKPTFWLYSEEDYRVESIPLVGKILVVKLDGDSVLCLDENEIELVKSKVMVDRRTNRYYLPLNDEYIRDANSFLNSLMKGE